MKVSLNLEKQNIREPAMYQRVIKIIIIHLGSFRPMFELLIELLILVLLESSFFFCYF